MRDTMKEGFSLVENMVALAILAIGLLGSASLFGTALQQMHASSTQRSAVMLSETLAEQLIAAQHTIRESQFSNCLIATQRCFDAAQLESSLASWYSRLQERIPTATAQLSARGGAATTTWTIQIHWIDRFAQTRSHVSELLMRQ